MTHVTVTLNNSHGNHDEAETMHTRLFAMCIIGKDIAKLFLLFDPINIPPCLSDVILSWPLVNFYVFVAVQDPHQYL